MKNEKALKYCGKPSMENGKDLKDGESLND